MIRIPRSITATIISLTLALFVVGAAVSVETRNYPWLSTSPSNTGEGGSYWFYRDLSLNYNVVIGNPYTIPEKDGRILYLVIGPDKPFKEEEAKIIAGRVENGSATLFIADETNNTARLLEALGLRAIGSTIYNGTVRGGGWEWVVSLSCFNETTYTTKAVRVNPGDSGRILCRYGDGSPAAVVYRVGNGTVVVVGDSSIFANFLYRGDYKMLPSTRKIALMLVDAFASGRSVIVFDSSHYAFQPGSRGLYYLSGLAGQVSYSLSSLAEKVRFTSRITLLLIVLSASAPWAVILILPSQPPPRKKTRLEAHEEWLLSVEASRIGVEVEGGGEGVDPVRVAKRILKVARSG